MNFLIILFFILLNDIAFSSPVHRHKHPSEALRSDNLFDGDIVLGKHINRTVDEFFNAVPNDNQLWPHGIIPYEIDIGLRGVIPLIESAFKHFHGHSCVHFRPRREERDYIYLHLGDGNRCSSKVGVGGGRQDVELGYSCHHIGTILHELMHVLGFYHEHSRSDRDQYLDVHLENVQEDKEQNFEILQETANRLLVPFDYQSITIYGEFSFSKNGLPTMVAKSREKLTDPNLKHSLTNFDIKAIKSLYQCH